MSQSSIAPPLGRASGSSADVSRRIVAEEPIQDMLDALDDADCRAILDATSERALSANEVSETCDLPLSTTYRKLGLLADAGLLEERTRIRRSGKHASEYVRLVEDVVVSLDPRGGIELRVVHREHVGQPDAPVLAGE